MYNIQFEINDKFILYLDLTKHALPKGYQILKIKHAMIANLF
jgi:hypothetical protein